MGLLYSGSLEMEDARIYDVEQSEQEVRSQSISITNFPTPAFTRLYHRASVSYLL